MDQNRNKGGKYQKKKKGGWKKGILIALATVLTLVLVLVGGVALYMNHLLNQINRPDDSVENTLSTEQVEQILQSGGEADDSFVFVPQEEPELEHEMITDETDAVNAGDNIINILLIGSDWRKGQSWELSDTMILCTINKETKTLTFTSFMRDMYVKLPDYNDMTCGYNRINCCYALGGMGMLDQCLLENFGVSVDHNVAVNFYNFSTIVDLLGGVDIELTGAEASHLNKHYGGVFQTGMNHLNGEQALSYARIRAIDSDFHRTNRQRTVLSAMVNSAKNLSLPELIAMVTEIVPLITTDMTNDEILSYVGELAPLLKGLKIDSLRIPADGSYYSAVKGSEQYPMHVLIPDLDENREILRSVLGETAVEATEETTGNE